MPLTDSKPQRRLLASFMFPNRPSLTMHSINRGNALFNRCFASRLEVTPRSSVRRRLGEWLLPQGKPWLIGGRWRSVVTRRREEL